MTSRRPQEPHPLHQSASPVDVPYVSRMPRLSANSAAAVKHCGEAKVLRACKPLESNSFCAVWPWAAPQFQWLAYEKRPVFRRLRESPSAISLLLDSSLPSANRRSIPPNVRGRQPVTPTDGVGAVPAGGGSSLPLSGGPGIDPAGITTGARGASLKRGALHRVKRGPDRASAHGRGERRGGAPKGERVPLNARPSPEAQLDGNIRCVARPHGIVAPFRRSASLLFFEAK